MFSCSFARCIINFVSHQLLGVGGWGLRVGGWGLRGWRLWFEGWGLEVGVGGLGV
jgi:hypothetical protein